jgi:hypothetical protein
MNYDMFTNAGNAAVHGIVVAADELDLTWQQVENILARLAQNKDFAEATDTAVRDVVYCALNFDKRG